MLSPLLLYGTHLLAARARVVHAHSVFLETGTARPFLLNAKRCMLPWRCANFFSATPRFSVSTPYPKPPFFLGENQKCNPTPNPIYPITYNLERGT